MFETKVEVSGDLQDPISLDIDHLASAIQALSDELLVMKFAKSVVEVSDKTQWEVILPR